MSSLFKSFYGNVGTRFSKRISLSVQLATKVPRRFSEREKENCYFWAVAC
jgi:hypothetical protein